MKKYIIPFIIGLVLIGVGSCYLVFEVLSFEETIYQGVPDMEKVEKFSYSLENNVMYNIDTYNSDQEVSVVIDNTLSNEMVISVTYDKYFGSIIINRYLHSSSNLGKEIYGLDFNIDNTNRISSIKKVISILKEMVSKKVFYSNLNSVFVPTIEVRISNENRSLLMINGSVFTPIENS